IPLRVPFITALGRRTDTVNVGIELRLKNGASGYGEASGSVVMGHLHPQTLARVLRRELARAVGQDARRLKCLIGEAWPRNSNHPPAAAAFESPLTEALARGMGMRLCDWFGGSLEEIETDLTLSASTPEAAAHAARRAAREEFRILKIKVGTGFNQDLK